MPEVRNLAHYVVPAGNRDEALADDGAWRPGWEGLGAELDAMGPTGLDKVGGQLISQLRENGVTYNQYGDGAEHERPWRLDPIPFVIGAAEWRVLADGLAQRARLLDAVLADCYGPNRLIDEGLLPPSAVFGHPGFLRPMHGVAPIGGHHLHVYAADLVRDASGRWQVLADRSQVPGGAGYALENRVVLSRALPGPFHRLGVTRLAGYYLALRRLLRGLAPAHRENPRVALLTPGPRSATYFEHAYLARYLGISLVEGADLTVRDQRVHLKTLTGLSPVDVILRRLDDDACDPLELRGDSLLGVPGLVQAVRAGNVAVVNALGSGLGENGALLPLMAGMCRRLLGEDLQLPSAESWCGVDAILPRLDAGEALVLRPIVGGTPVFSGDLDARARAELRERIRAPGALWLAQRHLPLVTAPTWQDGALVAKTVALRAFCVFDGAAWRVMPGGLCRVADRLGQAAISMQRGGGSKDCWVLAEGPVETMTLLPSRSAPLTLRRGGIDLPSRVADNLYWLGRYAERVEAAARLLRAAWSRVAEDDEDSDNARQLAMLVEALRQFGIGAFAEGDTPGVAAGLTRCICDRTCVGSLADALPRLQEAAFAVRDRISNDLWRVVVSLRAGLPATIDGAGEALAFLDRVVMASAAIAGMGSENTTRGPAWRFLDLGRRLERAKGTIELLRATVAEDAQDRDLDAVLEVADSSLTYRSRYQTILQAHAMLDLLLTDATNPRSVAFQLQVAVDHVANLPRDVELALPSKPERLAISVQTWMRLLDPYAVCRCDERGCRAELQHVLDHLSSDLGVLSDALVSHYFSHASVSRSLVGG